MCKTLCNFGFATFLFVISLAIVESCSAEDKTVGRGLVAHWTFAEGAGDAIRDSSAEGNHGTIVPENTRTSKWGTGEFAASASFSGDNDHFVRVPASASLNSLKKHISIAALIYPRSLSTPLDRFISRLQRKWKKGIQYVKNVLGIGVNNEKAEEESSTGYIAIVQRQWRETMHPDQYYLGYGPQNNVLHYKWHVGLMSDQAELYRLPEGQDKPRAREWVHLVGTYNGETGKMSLYVDGQLIGTQTHIGEIRLDPESVNRPLAIGAELNGLRTDQPTGEFDGYIRDVRIYDRALSDEEVKILADEAAKQVRR